MDHESGVGILTRSCGGGCAVHDTRRPTTELDSGEELPGVPVVDSARRGPKPSWRIQAKHYADTRQPSMDEFNDLGAARRQSHPTALYSGVELEAQGLEDEEATTLAIYNPTASSEREDRGVVEMEAGSRWRVRQ